MALGPYIKDRIRILLTKGGNPSDQISGGTPTVYVATDVQFEMAYSFLGSLVDASDFASITLAIKPGSNEDATPVISGTVAPGSTGWNSNPANQVNQQLVPNYAQYAATGSGATVSATYVSSTSITLAVTAGGTGYTAGAVLVFVGGGGTGSATPVFTAGVLTGFSAATFSGYTSAPSVYIVPATPTYTLGVQVGGTYQWVRGSNDTSLTNGSVTVGGGNQVPATATFSGGTYTLTGLLSSTPYYIIYGNVTSVSGAGITTTAGQGFFTTGSATTAATLNGPSGSLVTAQVFQSYLGANQVGGAVSYPSSTLVATGSNLVGNNVTAAVSYAAGSYTQANALVVGNSYYWTKGANDASVAASTAGTALTVSGVFVAVSATLNLTGTGTSPVTATVTPAYGAAAAGQSYGTFLITGLTAGATYTYTLGGNEPSPQGSASGQTAASGYFTPTTTSVLLTGLPSVAATVQVYATTGAAGSYVLSGLSAGTTYFWTKGANDVSCAGLVASGFFTANASQATLTGTGGASVSALVQSLNIINFGSFVAASDTVTFSGVSGASVTATLTGNVGWQANTDQLCVVPFTHVQTALLTTPDGGSQTYWLLVTATMTNGNEVVLGAGPLTVTDAGEQTPAVVPGNLVPGGAMYSGGGSYTLSGLISGAMYYWQQGADDTACAGLTASGNFVASGTTQVLTGTASTAVTAVVLQIQANYPTSGVVAVPQGASQVTVNNLTIPFVPKYIDCELMGGVADGVLDAKAVYTSISQTGFVANFTGTTLSANYVLGWTAH